MNLYSGYSAWKYDKDALRLRVKAIKRAVEDPKLRQLVGDFDAVVLTGSSGTWLGGMLALELDVPVVLCRKDGERSHGGVFEGASDAIKRLLIVDDFVSSGDTVRRVRDQWKAYAFQRSGESLSYEVVGCLQHGYLVNDENVGTCERYGALSCANGVQYSVDGIPCVSRNRT